jgi:hypothetical protein
MVPVSRVFVPEKKLMKKYGTTTSELRAIEMQERREFFKKKLHVPYSLCLLTLIPNRQQKLHAGDIKLKENTKNGCRKERFKTLKGYRSPGKVRKNLLTGKREREEDDGKAERWRWSLLQ